MLVASPSPPSCSASAVPWCGQGRSRPGSFRRGGSRSDSSVSVVLGDLAGDVRAFHAARRRPSAHAGRVVRRGASAGVSTGRSASRGALVVLRRALVVAVMVSTGIGLRALVRRFRPRSRARRRRHGWHGGGRVRRLATTSVTSRSRHRRPGVEALALEAATSPNRLPEPVVYEDEFRRRGDGESTRRRVRRPMKCPSHGARRPKPRRWRVTGCCHHRRCSCAPRSRSQDRAAIEAAGHELVEALAAHGVDTTLVRLHRRTDGDALRARTGTGRESRRA